MKLIIRKSQSSLSREDQDGVLNKKYLVLVKNVLPRNVCLKIRQELNLWRELEPPETESSAVQKDLANYHLDLSFRGQNHGSRLDFKTGHTSIIAHNFRLSDFDALFLKEKMPVLHSAIPNLKNIFFSSIGSEGFKGDDDSAKRLYLECVHFPAGNGQLEPHTHQTMVNNGLFVNALFLLSQKGEDYLDGGLVFGKPGEQVDLSDVFRQGDILLFHNSIPHHVTRIEGKANPLKGRWVMSFYYY